MLKEDMDVIFLLNMVKHLKHLKININLVNKKKEELMKKILTLKKEAKNL